jgi:hypothetical protein
MIFAPVRFAANVYSRPGYHYRPTTVISLSVFIDHLFLRPRHRHYYFGDYYANEYRRSGYFSSHSYHSGGHGYDPIFAHERWVHRQDNRWERRIEENDTFFREHKEERPPHTLAALQKFNAQPDNRRRVKAGFARPLSDLVTSKESAIRFKAVNEDERRKFVQLGREIRDFSDQQRNLGKKTANDADTKKPGKGEPTRVKFQRSPIFSKASEQPANEDTPPKRPEVRLPDAQSEHKPGPERRPGDKPKRDSDQQPEDQPGRKPKLDPQDQPKLKPKIEPRAEPRREPKAEPKREPKAEPKRELKAEPKRELKAKPKREPKAEPPKEQSSPNKGPDKPADKDNEKPRRP